MPTLFDHCYFEHDGLRLRVIGPFYSGLAVTFLVRTVLVEGIWVKPPLYATEVADDTLVNRLKNYTKQRVANRDLPTIDLTLLGDPIDPYGWRENKAVSLETRTLLKGLCINSGIEVDGKWGLGGSRLLGSAHSCSDIDLIFPASGECLRLQFLDALNELSVARPEGHSGRARRFLGIYSGSELNLQARNVFGGLWNGLRVDMFSTFPEELARAAATENATESDQEDRQCVFRVISSKGRLHYPIHLVGVEVSNPKLSIDFFSFDTAMHYVLDGDVVSVSRARFFRGCDGACIAHFTTADDVR